MKTMCDEIDQTCSAVLAVEKSVEIFERSINSQLKAKEHDNAKDCFRVQGLKEGPSKAHQGRPIKLWI